MKIELKNIKFSEHLSEETNAFTANIYADGKHIGYAKNNGQGGMTDTHCLGQDTRQAFKDAEAYALSLPKIEYDDFSIPSNLENIVDNLFVKWGEKQHLIKESNKGVIYKDINDGETYVIPYGRKINEMKKLPQGIIALKKTISRLKAEGHTILNVNLAEYL